jgi:hypothetical protein
MKILSTRIESGQNARLLSLSQRFSHGLFHHLLCLALSPSSTSLREYEALLQLSHTSQRYSNNNIPTIIQQQSYSNNNVAVMYSIPSMRRLLITYTCLNYVLLPQRHLSHHFCLWRLLEMRRMVSFVNRSLTCVVVSEVSQGNKCALLWRTLIIEWNWVELLW